MNPEQSNPHLLIEKAAKWSQYLTNRLNAEKDFGERLALDIQSPLLPETVDSWLKDAFGELQTLSENDYELLKNGDIRDIRANNRIAELLAIDHCKSVLRKARKRVFCTLAVRDIGALAELEEVLVAISYFADVAVQITYRAAMLQFITRHGIPLDPQSGEALDMLIIGMGKLGGKELNVSSDIDLVMLYPVEGQTVANAQERSISHHEFYTKVTQRIANILSEHTADGFVFRCDLRLRPDGGGSALAWSLEALRNYLLKQGREWERYAWLKARAIPIKAFNDSRDQHFLQQFLSIQSPFVFRKYFDFDTLAALRSLREQIREDWHHRSNNRGIVRSHDNIKLGEGGIREIEFIVQLAQLVRGGQMPSLRQASFFKALDAELQAGIIDENEEQMLQEAYRFLRRIEHLLQYKTDQQTHLLPQNTEELAHLASLFDLSLNEFDTKLQQYRDDVSRVFKAAFRIVGVESEADAESAAESSSETKSEVGPDINPGTDPETPLTEAAVPEDMAESEQQEFARAFEDIAFITAIEPMLNSLQQNYRIKNLNEQAKNRLNSLLPKMIKAVSKAKQPVNTFSRLMDLVENVVQRSSYMALLDEYPEVLGRIIRMLDISPWIADYITRNPIVLDKLIDWQELLEPIDIDSIMEQLQLDLDASLLEDGSPDMELQMNLMRDLKKQITFQLLAQDIEGIITVEHLADILSLLADRLLAESMRRVWPLVCQRYDSSSMPQQPKFAVISYGRLGGKELGYVSDLDLVFLFDDASVQGIEIYTRFARRLTNWLSTMTSSGRLYDIDTRLRPDGNAGLLAVSIDGFENYQLHSAWLWEHQALTRARFTAGDESIGRRFEDLRKSILIRKRDLATLKQGIVDMRQRIHEGYPNHSVFFDLKHDQGGMVDIEFITQYIVLAYSHQYPELIKNLGNITLIKMAGDYGLLPEPLAHQVADIYRVYRAKQHSLRLQGDDRARTEPQSMKNEREAVIELWNSVFPKAKKFNRS
ncbi:Bifunctional glutamine synthetase adenylyltransferase/adenylyl-removing enzyme [Oligella sp. MSHR50489EDL]|uniref:bifunctional [glutamate--ammonia ligase]-adenylyl-L-tyrosine phosphorylase/[glutamate--ammonia-ligase] adenylyltransferase n=1 Tax=Oligella sp. MSHR50489EDL TaxID=3139409 RepID=UPI003D81C231